jgi:glycosyltransferase involved in cell wall biosynthesis
VITSYLTHQTYLTNFFIAEKLTKHSSIMTHLKKLTFHHNFNAEFFCVTPEVDGFQVSTDLLIESGLFEKIEDDCVVWVFGNYDVPKEEIDRVKHFDFPTSQTQKQMNFHGLVIDSWYNIWEDLQEIANVQKNNQKIKWIITSEYLSLLCDPRPLLWAFKRLSLNAVGQYEVSFVYSPFKGGIRNWNQASFFEWIESAGFTLETQEETRKNTAVDIRRGYVNKEQYQAYLKKIGLENACIDSDWLLVTTEDLGITQLNKKSIGAGRYVSEVKKLNKKAVSLLCDLEKEKCKKDGRSVLLTEILGETKVRDVVDGFLLIDAVRAMLFVLPWIKVVETTDGSSIGKGLVHLGFRLVQGKKTGLLPSHLVMRNVLQSGVEYEKHTAAIGQEISDYTIEEIRTIIKSHYVSKEADENWTFSGDMESLLSKEFGHQFSMIRRVGLPIDLKTGRYENALSLGKIEELVFINHEEGERGRRDFVESMEYFFQSDAPENPSIKNIKSIKVITTTPSKQFKCDDIKRLKKLRTFSEITINRNDWLNTIKAQRANSLFIMTSRCESYSFELRELFLIGARLVAYQAVTDIIDHIAYSQRFLSEENARSLSEKIKSVLIGIIKEDERLIREVKESTWKKQKETNLFFSETSTFAEKKIIQRMSNEESLQDVSVATPVYNTKITYLEELYESILRLQIKPKEWILVNDGSQTEYTKQLEAFVRSCRKITIRLVHQENKGPAAAKSRCITVSSTKYTFLFDSDDVFLPWTMSDALVALESNPTLILTAGFIVHTNDPKSIKLKQSTPTLSWMPLGVPQSRVLSARNHEFGPACVLLRTAAFQAVEYWDKTDKSSWDDYAFYTKLAWSEQAFCLTPTLSYLYRKTQGSVSQTYNIYFGKRRVIRSMEGKVNLTRLDALILQNLTRQVVSEKELILLKLFRKIFRPLLKIVRRV